MGKLQILIAFTVGVSLFSCESLESDFVNDDALVADFAYQIEGDCSTPVLEVILENKTLGADSYFWDFGDGTTSFQQNPKKVYPKWGTYTISLTAYFSDDTVHIEKPVSIVRNSDGTGPRGQMSFQRSNATSLEVTFEIGTDEPAYRLYFGDGTIIVSGEKEIKHVYSGLGSYSALLVVQNSEGCNCATTSIHLTP